MSQDVAADGPVRQPTSLILSLFPGIGLLDSAFEAEGFCIVRGPDLLWGGDIKRFHPPAGVFGGVIGGPPCQLFSRLYNIVLSNNRKNPERYKADAENLIPEFERVVREATPIWFLMENVPGAPLPRIDGYQVTSQLVQNRWLGEEQRRERVFSFGYMGNQSVNPWGHIEWAIFDNPAYSPAVCASGSTAVPVAMGGSGKTKRGKIYGDTSSKYLREAIRLQGLPPDFLSSSPFTVKGKIHAIGNGVPFPMGRAVAKAIKRALYSHESPIPKQPQGSAQSRRDCFPKNTWENSHALGVSLV